MQENVEEKIVGTSYVPNLPSFEAYQGSVGVANGVAVKTCRGLVVPEPSTAFNSQAIAVYIELTDGTAQRIGYLARHSALASQIKGKTSALISVTNYASVGLSDSFKLVQIG